MSSKEAVAEVTKLAAEYQGAIHLHKDRDCHWGIDTRWSYGEGPKFIAWHHGYLSEPWKYGESDPHDTFIEAAAALCLALTQAIVDAQEQR